MSILPGIYASQITGHLSTLAYDSIATQTVGSGGSSGVTFSSIPQTYKHLQIRVLGRTTNAEVNFSIKFNSDAGNNYSGHYLYGDGSSAGAGTLFGGGGGPAFVGRIPASSVGANIFGTAVIDILDYTNTNKYKTIKSLNGYDANGSGQLFFLSDLWLNTNAISSIDFIVTGTNSIAQYSSFALYGVKG